MPTNPLVVLLIGVAIGGALVGGWWWWIGHRNKVRAIVAQAQQAAQKVQGKG